LHYERAAGGRGLSQGRLERIQAAYHILREIQPATVRSVAYKLFTRGLIDNMSKGETNKVSDDLTLARDEGVIPWHWIVDNSRKIRRVSTWRDTADFGETVVRAYRKDFWQHQKERVEVWSEKATVEGVLAPVLEEFAVQFRVFTGYGSTTRVCR
jgi:hypothetical protein